MTTAYMMFPGFRYKAVTLSYDDGMMFDPQLIERMDKYGLKGTFNLNSGQMAEKPYQEEYLHGRLTAEQCVETYQNSGHEVAVHGYKHLSLPAYDTATKMNDVLFDRRTLEQMFGRVIKGMAYAYGTYDDDTLDVLKKCGIVYSRTINDTHNFELPKDWLKMHPTCHHNDEKLLELAQKFVDMEVDYECWWSWFNQSVKWFCLWGHSSEFFRDQNWDIIDKFGQIVGGREDIWHVTTGELYAYVQAFQSLEWSVEGKAVHNPSSIDV